MAKNKMTFSQLNNQIFTGQVGTEVAAGLKSFVPALNNGFTMLNSNTRIRFDVAGTYFIFARQLISTNANTIYYQILKNGSVVAYDYRNLNVGTTDVNVSYSDTFAAGDYIEMGLSLSIAACWAGPHSHISIIRVA